MIRFHYAYPSFKVNQATKVKAWLNSVAKSEDKNIDQLEFHFVDDEALLDINRQSLNHDYYTDIITFPYAYEPISGELFISIDRIRDHAAQYKVTPQQELLRVMVHGVLHLCGYDDKGGKHKKQMTVKEDFYLARLEMTAF